MQPVFWYICVFAIHYLNCGNSVATTRWNVIRVMPPVRRKFLDQTELGHSLGDGETLLVNVEWTDSSFHKYVIED